MAAGRRVAGRPAGRQEMRPTVVSTLRLSQISRPRHDFTVHRSSVTERMRARIEAGEFVPPVMVARLGGKYYPFGNFEALDAYRALAVDVPCHVYDAAAQVNVLELHLAHGQKEPLNPLLYMEGIRDLCESDGDMSVVPKEYQSFGTEPVMLTKAARGIFLDFVQEVSDEYDVMFDWYHVLEEIARLEASTQERALGEILRFVRGQKRPIPPDMTSLRCIIDGFASPSRRRRMYADDDDVDGDEDDDDVDGDEDGGGGGAAARKKKRKNAAGDAEAESVIVSAKSKGAMPLVPSPVPATLTHSCKCGQEFLINTKNATVRMMTPTDDNVIVLEGDEGRTVYAIPQNGVEFLELGLQPRLHVYCIGGEKTEDGERGHTLVVSKRHITRQGQSAIRRIVDGTAEGGGPSGGNGSRRKRRE